MNGASECVSSRSLQKFEMVKRAWTKTQKRKPLTSFPEISFANSGSPESKTVLQVCLGRIRADPSLRPVLLLEVVVTACTANI